MGADPVTRPLDEVFAGEVLDGEPVRRPGAYKGQWSKPGWYWMASVGRHVSFESRFERTALRFADFTGGVVAVLPQPLTLHFDRDASPKRHTPDYMFGYADGSVELVDVKGARHLGKDQIRVGFSLTAAACHTLGWGFRVFTEPDWVLDANIAYLGGYRSVRASALDAYTPALIDAVADTGDAGLSVVAATVSLAADGVPSAVARAAVWRALWMRALRADLDAPLEDATTVHLPAEHHRAQS